MCALPYDRAELAACARACVFTLFLTWASWFAAFIQMAADIKTRMAMVPQDTGAAAGGTVSVGRGEQVKAASGGGCC